MNKVIFFLLLFLGTFPCFAQPSRVRVVILGGGVSGMSAAHELAERGFNVVVYEKNSGIPGGKARSMSIPGTGTEGRRDLPVEHGLRFFPASYRNLMDIMRRIPTENGRTAYDNLLPVPRLYWARIGLLPVTLPARQPRNMLEFEEYARFIFRGQFNISNAEISYFLRRMFQFMTSSEERRRLEYERISWWDYIGAGTRSKEYQKYFGIGFTRNIAAARGDLVSARTAGNFLLQLMMPVFGYGTEEADHVLNGPTNEVWIDPWLHHLRKLGVEYNFNAIAESIQYKDGKVVSVTIRQGDQVFDVEADYILSAMPVEAIAPLISDELAIADPQLARLKNLQTEWMNGSQFFLSERISVAPAHINLYDAPWAITLIFQGQFWKYLNPLHHFGDGNIEDILSLVIADWNTPGILYGKPAKECTKEEIRNEVLAQVMRHLDPVTAMKLERSIQLWFLDSDIHFPAPGGQSEMSNDEPLMVNTPGSWNNRPTAVTAIPNFFLSGDYVRTSYDVATMEAATEAARRAVNGIIIQSAEDVPLAEIYLLREPRIFEPAKAIDRMRFRSRKPHILERSFCERLLSIR